MFKKCLINHFFEIFFLDSLVVMEKVMKRDHINTNDRQLACAKINSVEGQDYLKGMASAANYAWVNRSSMTFLARQVSTFIVLHNTASYRVLFNFCMIKLKIFFFAFYAANLYFIISMESVCEKFL